jgi:hypothetical protein
VNGAGVRVPAWVNVEFDGVPKSTWKRQTFQVGFVPISVNGFGAPEGGWLIPSRSDDRRRAAGEHGCAVERERLRAEELRSRRVEDVRAHVVRVRPDAELRVVVEVVPELGP